MKHLGGMTDFEGKMTSATLERLTPPSSSNALADQWKWPLAGGVLLLGILALVFWDFFARQVALAITEQADNGHTLVVPFIAGYFVYFNRAKLLAQPFRTSWIGLVPIVLGVAWYIECSIGLRPLRHHNLQAVGVISTLSGLALLFCGWRAMLWLWFPLLYLFFFGQTISAGLLNIVTFRMQDITARGAHLLLQLGMDVDRSGNTLYIFLNGPSKTQNIDQACSGIRMLMAFLALGVAMAFTGFKMYWQQVLLVAMAVPIAIFVNILRVVSLGILSLYDTGFAAGDFHSFVGLVWLVPAFLIFLGFMWIIRHLVVEEDDVRPVAARRNA